ncbi:MAG: aminoacyl-tRNA hydrolase [Candidatus Dormibacteraceae bacterium]
MENLLIVGLGNPGREYAGTRHNLGAECVEVLARRRGVQLNRRRWKSLVGFQDSTPEQRVWFIWPQTFMNQSGQSVAAAARDLEVAPESVWAVYDELDLPLCRLRIRRGGSAAGHNGVRSLMSSLHTHEFVRFRIGIGRPDGDGIDHVLGRFGKRESESLGAIREGVADALALAIEGGVQAAMDQFNRAGSLGCQEIP